MVPPRRRREGKGTAFWEGAPRFCGFEADQKEHPHICGVQQSRRVAESQAVAGVRLRTPTGRQRRAATSSRLWWVR